MKSTLRSEEPIDEGQDRDVYWIAGSCRDDPSVDLLHVPNHVAFLCQADHVGIDHRLVCHSPFLDEDRLTCIEEDISSFVG